MLFIVLLFLEFDGALLSFRQFFTFALKLLCYFFRRRHFPLRTIVSDRKRHIEVKFIYNEERAYISYIIYIIIIYKFC
jgi:hypothetical protein